MGSEKRYAGMDYESALRKYADHITRICVLNVGNPEDAKDCFQNVFLKLYLSDKIFSSEEHLKAWLIRVAINECKDFHKTLWKRRVDLGYQGIAEENLKKEENVVCSEECMEVMEELRRLPDKYRQVLYLYYCGEYSTPEIAELLDISINTVKSRLMRGRQKLSSRVPNPAFTERKVQNK